MNILEQALNKINSINKNQKTFFMILIQGLIGIAGKRTFRNLARYMQMAEHTFSRQMAKAFDFIGLNFEMIKSTKRDDDELIATQDSSFIKKSGKLTHGICSFWNGSEGKSEKGLEIDVIAIIKTNSIKKEGYTLSAKQTPANPIPKEERKKRKKEKTELSKIDYYLNHVKEAISKIIDLGIKYMIVDAFYTKYKYVNGVVALGLNVIGKLRIDAILRKAYNGPQKARGRKKIFETGKINFEDFSNSDVIEVISEKTELRTIIAYSQSLKRLIKVVLVKRIFDNNKQGEALLFSTDTKIESEKIYKYYVARFQIEFIFRDAKGFTGLDDCQSRDSRRLNYHFNASLLALNVAKFQDNELQQKQQVQHAFSMANWARKYHVDIVINQFISMFGLDQTLIKLHANYNSMLEYGSINH